MRRMFVALSLLLFLTTALPASQGEPEGEPEISEEWVALESVTAEDLEHILGGFIQLGFCVSAEDCGNWIRQCVAGVIEPCSIGAVCVGFVVTGPLVPSPQQVAGGSADLVGKGFKVRLGTPGQPTVINVSGNFGQGYYQLGLGVAGQPGC